MPRPILDTTECIACEVCVEACPQGVLAVKSDVVEVVDEESCIGCGDCMEECPMGCITEIQEDQFLFSFSINFSERLK